MCREVPVPFFNGLLGPRQPLGQIVLPADIRQAAIAAFEQVDQLFVVEAQEREHRGVQIVDVHLVVHGAETHFIGGPDRLAAAHSAAGQPG